LSCIREIVIISQYNVVQYVCRTTIAIQRLTTNRNRYQCTAVCDSQIDGQLSNVRDCIKMNALFGKMAPNSRDGSIRDL